MRTMLLAAVGLLLVAGARGEEAAKADLDKVQGVWHAISMEVDGKAVEVVKDERTIISGKTFTVKDGDQVIRGGTFTLDAGKSPKAIDSSYTAGPHKGETKKGIYALEADTWKVCLGAVGKDRPTHFSSQGGGVMLVLKRVSK